MGAKLGVIDGVYVGLSIGTAEGDTVPTITHTPQEVLPDTRVPTPAKYLPVIPVIFTSMPVVAPTPPPEAHELPSGIQLPGEPETVALYGRVALGLPIPVYPELTVNRQPLTQYVAVMHAVGQSAERT